VHESFWASLNSYPFRRESDQALQFLAENLMYSLLKFGQFKEGNGIWRIKTNKGLDELIKPWNINYVKAQRLSLFGHINTGSGRKPSRFLS
jgi:hypothetical protein